jgi:hypothetical protein
MDYESGKIWEEVVVVYCTLLYQYLSEDTKKF